MTLQLTRRQLLAAGGGMALGSWALPTALRRIVDTVDPARPGSDPTLAGGPISEIKHVVVLMQENRSFDHYFGAMPGVRGFADKSALSGVFQQPDSSNPDGYLLPFHADTQTSSAQQLPSNSHSWGPQHESWNNGQMNGFVSSHIAEAGSSGQYTMAYFKRNDIPFHWALADAFTICDSYHCSMLGPTWPNRLYLMSGMVDPTNTGGGPVYENDVPGDGFTWETYPEMLTKAGVDWKVYQEIDNYGLNVLEYFTKYQDAPPSSALYKNALRYYQAGQFEHDAANDQLPTISWILPPSYQSEHPDFMPAAGADFVASKVNAIASNPEVWKKTLFVLIYDENDGLFDHVVPPTAPVGTPAEYITVDNVSAPIGLGFRVPCILVSHWTVGGYVSHEMFDHTSVLQLMEKVTGVSCTNISAWRRQTVSDLTVAMGSKAKRAPRLPGTAAQLAAAEEQARKFPLPPIPGKNQVPPTQGQGHKPTVNNPSFLVEA